MNTRVVLLVGLAAGSVGLPAVAWNPSPAGGHWSRQACQAESPVRGGSRLRAEQAAAAAAAMEQFSATDLTGQRWTAADLRGRVVLLDFWATWCAPCLADLPLLDMLRAKHSRADFEILGISLDVTSRRAFVSWLNRNRVDWPQVHDRSGYAGKVPRLFGIDQLPSTIVVGRDGRPAGIDVRGERLVALVDALVADELVEPEQAELR